MKELSEIVGAFDDLRAAGKPAALATVIGVEGSSYRRPGARMLIAEDGRIWGGVSGGCLERDVAARGRGVIATGRPVICRYDTGDDEVPSVGASTGCGGAVELLIQPLSPAFPGPLPQLARLLQARRPITIATVVRASGSQAGSEGTCLAVEDEAIDENAKDHDNLRRGAQSAIDVSPADAKWPRIVTHRSDNGTADLFIEHLQPPQAIVIFGAGPDAVPLVVMAKALGWHVTVVGTRPATAMPERFPTADTLRVSGSDDPTEGVEFPPDCAVVVMTHNLARDRAILERVPRTVRYLGILGPRIRTERIFSEIADPSALATAFAPVGLDLGAQTPEEIALSIVAEIQAVTHDTPVISLRDRSGPIHPRQEDEPTQRPSRQVGSACAV